MRGTAKRSGFSLVEMALALGLVAFCVVALIGLMSPSLESIGNADSEAAAAQWLRQLATGIRGASPDANGIYRLPGFRPFSSLAWVADGKPLPVEEGFLDQGGSAVDASVATFAYRVEIVAPDADAPASLGRAVLRIAWPPAARWTNGEWTHAQGSEEALMLFRAK